MKYVLGAVLAATSLFLGARMAHGTQPERAEQTVTVGAQATGTLSWVMYAMQHYGFDKQYHLNLKVKRLANKTAAMLALRAGSVDLEVTDFISAQLMYNNGVPLQVVFPYSKATGGIVVRTSSDIKTVDDLKGRRIAATAVNDNSLLFLRTLLIKTHGSDAQAANRIVSAAPPLMESLLGRGDVDAAIPYWHFVARMVGSGKYRELISDADVLQQLGLDANLPLLVLVARKELDAKVTANFIKALVATTAKMRADDAIWQDILDQGLYKLPDPALFPAVRARWEAGLPSEWNRQNVDALARLVDKLVAVAGVGVIGVSKIDPLIFNTGYDPWASQQ